ncbi:unnamed protein product [Alternaria alternata]
MYDLFGADHETSTLEFAIGDSDHQFSHELCDEGEKSRETLHLALNDSLNGSTPGDHAEQRDDLDAAVRYAFSAEDNQSTYHGEQNDLIDQWSCVDTFKVGPPVEDETFFGVASVTEGLPTTQKRSHQSSIADAATTILEAVPDIVSHPEPEKLHSVKRRRMAERQAQSLVIKSTYTPKSAPLLDPSHQASCLSTSDGPIVSSPGADDREHGIISLALSSTNHYDVEYGDGAYVQGAVEEQSQARRSGNYLEVVALGRKVLGEQGKVIRMTQMSPDSWVLLGYRCNSSVLDLCNRRSPNTEWVNGFHNDAATYEMDYSDNDDNDHDCDEENEHEEEFTERYSQRIRKLWLESEEVLLLSLKDKQGMAWEEVCKRFPGRSVGAIKLRYYTLRKRG